MIRIAVTGPESTGKTTLAQSLALSFGTLWVPEFAREYLQDVAGDYTYDDVEKIALGQLKSENEYAAKSSGLLICDTDLVVIKIWMEFRFGVCPEWINESIKQSNYRLHLLCYPDIPWTYDKLREHPNQRMQLFRLYENVMLDYNLPHVLIKGDEALRLETAYKAVKAFCE